MPLYINHTEITDEQVFAEMQYHPASSLSEAQEKAAQALAIRELLLQEAARLGITAPDASATQEAQEDFLISRLLEQEVVTPEPDEVTCQRYYEQKQDTVSATLADIIAINNSNPDVYMPFGQARLEEAENCELSSADDTTQTDEAVTTAQAYLDDLFASNDVDALVTLDDTFSLEYGLAGYPAITVPRGGYDDWSPTSITLVGPSCSDATLIGYAYAYEQHGPHRLLHLRH